MKIGLVLSGGGTRAAVFHLGVLRCLAEAGKLEDVSRISSVSGGSLVTALIFSWSGMEWPDSKKYLNEVYPKLEALLTTTDLLSMSMFLCPTNWFYLTHRARLLGKQLEKKWGVSGKLADLPDHPLWEINATTFETGKNWYFSKKHMGDWVYGEHPVPPFSIAEACAASAAVPYALGALKLKMPDDGKWKKSGYPGDMQLESEERLRKVRLWDGGAYENLGSERISKIGRNPKGCDFVIISDASAPLKINPPSVLKKVIRLLSGKLDGPRLFDITSEQTRSLRVRAFWSDLKNEALKLKGVHIPIGKTVKDIDGYVEREPRTEKEYAAFLSSKEVDEAAQHATTLKKLSVEDFLRLVRHGHENAQAALEGAELKNAKPV